jgi:hypothetical protein
MAKSLIVLDSEGIHVVVNYNVYNLVDWSSYLS